MVVSNLSAKILFAALVDAAHLPEDYLRDLRDFRTFSTAFKINVACRAPAAIHGVRCGELRLRLTDLRPHRARHRVSRARLRRRHARLAGPRRPFVTPVVPTIRDDTMAPPRQARGQPVRRPCAL